MGRKILFRPERYHAGSLFRDVKPIIEIEQDTYVVRDLSMSGFLLVAPEGGHRFARGDKVEFRLLLGESVAHEGSATVIRMEPHGSGAKIGLQLTDGFINIPALLSLHEGCALEQLVEEGIQAEIDLVPGEYRQLCSEAVFLLRRTKEILDRNDKREKNRTSMLPGEEVTDLFEARCEKHFLASWDAIRARGNAIVQPLMSNTPVIKAIKKFTETVLTPELTIAPSYKRAYEKPLGYPGDFELMKYFYSGKRHGDTTYVRLLHHLVNIHPFSMSVPSRMREVKEAIRQTVATTKVKDRPVRIANLGAGPAREVREYLRTCKPEQPVHFSLIDQDEKALAYAYSQALPYKMAAGDHVVVECKFASFGQLLKNPELLKEMAGQDLVYSAGLFDYLPTGIAQNLVRALYSCLNPGGTLIVGNLKAPTDGIWSAEFVCDWSMIYRTKEDMEELVAGVSSDYDVRPEPTGYTYLLSIKKPQ